MDAELVEVSMDKKKTHLRAKQRVDKRGWVARWKQVFDAKSVSVRELCGESQGERVNLRSERQSQRWRQEEAER